MLLSIGDPTRRTGSASSPHSLSLFATISDAILQAPFLCPYELLFSWPLSLPRAQAASSQRHPLSPPPPPPPPFPAPHHHHHHHLPPFCPPPSRLLFCPPFPFALFLLISSASSPSSLLFVLPLLLCPVASCSPLPFPPPFPPLQLRSSSSLAPSSPSSFSYAFIIFLLVLILSPILDVPSPPPLSFLTPPLCAFSSSSSCFLPFSSFASPSSLRRSAPENSENCRL